MPSWAETSGPGGAPYHRWVGPSPTTVASRATGPSGPTAPRNRARPSGRGASRRKSSSRLQISLTGRPVAWAIAMACGNGLAVRYRKCRPKNPPSICEWIRTCAGSIPAAEAAAPWNCSGAWFGSQRSSVPSSLKRAVADGGSSWPCTTKGASYCASITLSAWDRAEAASPVASISTASPLASDRVARKLSEEKSAGIGHSASPSAHST